MKKGRGRGKFIKKMDNASVKISCFMCITNPKKRGDTYLEAIKSHLLFCDELVIVDGGSTDGSLKDINLLNDPRIRIVSLPWAEDWSWEEFATHWNFGYQNCTGDWVGAGETDHIWEAAQAERVREFLSMPSLQELTVVAVEKFQLVTVDRGFNKSGFPYFLNKAKCGSSIGYGYDPDYHTDLAAPIHIKKQIYPLFYEGIAIRDEGVKKFRLHFINYLWTFKTGNMILKEREKGFNGWNRFYGSKKPVLPYPGGNSLSTIKSSLEMSYTRLAKCTKMMFLKDHPKFMVDKIKKELKPGMFGYDLCGWGNGHSIVPDYFDTDKVITINNFVDHRGRLIPLDKEIPFAVKRVYFITDVPTSVISRAGHAHKINRQALIAVKGQCTVSIFKDSTNKQDYILNSPRKCMILEPEDWHILGNFSSDCVLAVLASEHYDLNDYIDQL